MPFTFERNKLYRFVNCAYPNKALNAYGTNAVATGRNVCLYTDDPDDIMQKWRYRETVNGDAFLASAVDANFVLDRSSGISGSPANNAHMCSLSQTSINDYALEFNFISGNRCNIKLANQGNLLLTARNNGTPTSGTISSLTAPGNVCWYSTSVSDTAAQWYVEEVVSEEEPNEFDYIINNVGLPLADCPVGSYWTNSGNPTDADGTDSKNHHGIQCAGFARYVYEQIWGSDSNGHQFHSNKDYLEETTGQGDLDDFPLGTRIVCTVRKSFAPGTENFDNVRTDPHHMILVAKTSTSVTLYHANWDNKCGIAIDTWTNSEFYNRFKEIKGATFIPY